MINEINNLILKITGLTLIKPYPKHSIRFAKKYFESKSPLCVVEIGTFRGVNAKHILDNLKTKKIYLVDPYGKYTDGSTNKKRVVTKQDLSKPKKEAHNRLRYYDQKGYIKWVEKYSDDAVKQIPLSDYIYIDGEHSYEQVKKDLENYYPKLKGSGIMAGHDIHLVGVLNAVQDFTRKKDLHFQVAGQDWWFIKPSTKD